MGHYFDCPDCGEERNNCSCVRKARGLKAPPTVAEWGASRAGANIVHSRGGASRVVARFMDKAERDFALEAIRDHAAALPVLDAVRGYLKARWELRPRDPEMKAFLDAEIAMEKAFKIFWDRPK